MTFFHTCRRMIGIKTIKISSTLRFSSLMASINVGKDPYPCFCGGSRTYEICETPRDYFFFMVPVPELVKKYPSYKTIVCDNCGNVQVLLIKS